jgi:hypothetical protein
VALSRRAIGFELDLFELVCAILISPVRPGGDVEPNLSVDLVGIVCVAEDGNNFSLQLWSGLLRLRVSASEDEVDH